MLLRRLVGLLLFLFTASFAEVSAQQYLEFIENKGQFTIPKSFGNDSPILFAVDHGGTKIFFTKKGITGIKDNIHV